jgi:hypothetical protein
VSLVFSSLAHMANVGILSTIRSDGPHPNGVPGSLQGIELTKHVFNPGLTDGHSLSVA